MIQFRQKEFCAALGGALARIGSFAVKNPKIMSAATNLGIMGGTTLLGAKISGDQQKEATAASEEMTNKQNEQIAAQTRALNRLASVAKDNPQVAQQAGQIMQQQYSVVNEALGFGKIVKNLAKDRNVLSKVAKGTVTGLGMGAAGYATDKAIQHDAKKNGIAVEKPEEDKSKRKKTAAKIAAGTGSVLALAYGAKKGYLPKNVSEGIKKVGTAFKTAGKEAVWKNGKLNTGELVTTGAFGAGLPLATYLPKRQQAIDQQRQTEERQYSTASVLAKTTGKVIGNGIKKGAKSVVGGIGSFFSGGATKGTKKFADDMIEYGVKNKNKTAQTVGKFMKKHDKLTKVAAIPVGSAVAFKPWEVGENAVKNASGVVDKNAFAYQKSQDKEIE